MLVSSWASPLLISLVSRGKENLVELRPRTQAQLAFIPAVTAPPVRASGTDTQNGTLENKEQGKAKRTRC
jgi:hypothetical protein